MPVHDWTRVDAGLFHHFHQRWSVSICDALNAGALPREFFAMVEQNIRGPIPDILTLQLASDKDMPDDDAPGGAAVVTAPPRTRVTKKAEADSYLQKTNRVTVRHRHGKVVAVIEIVSPGNKGSRSAFRTFVEKSTELVLQGIHLLVIDLFPRGPRDPDGIAKALWDEFVVEDFEQFPDKPLTLISIDAGFERAMHVEPIALGDVLLDMPLFLKPATYIHAPLESTYQEAWRLFPAPMKKLLT
jgi:hypothetical protein